MVAEAKAFWKTKSLAEMTTEEWESVCDGCGRCCLHKLQDEDSGLMFYTNVACRLLDREHCRCGNYPQRMEIVHDCLSLADNAAQCRVSCCSRTSGHFLQSEQMPDLQRN